MSDRTEEKNKLLLRTLQDGFPLAPRPFAIVAERLGWTEEEVLLRLTDMINEEKVRKVGAVLNPKKMGYVSTLAATNVPSDEIESAAKVINSFTGVTHNYLREGEPNIWFTLTEENEDTLNANLGMIEREIRSKVVKLPATRTFKIGVKLDV